MTITQNDITEQLDSFEASLPTIPSKTLAFGRAAARRTTDVATTVIGEISDRANSVAKSIGTATKTTTGQARSAADRTAQAVRNNVAEVAGQASSQARRSGEAIADETTALIDDATDAVDPVIHDPASFADLTKSELYAIAQDRDIEGRASMTKSELVTALRA